MRHKVARWKWGAVLQLRNFTKNELQNCGICGVFYTKYQCIVTSYRSKENIKRLSMCSFTLHIGVLCVTDVRAMLLVVCQKKCNIFRKVYFRKSRKHFLYKEKSNKTESINCVQLLCEILQT